MSEHQQNQDQEIINLRAKTLIEKHLAYAHAIAADMSSRFPPQVERDELNSAAEYGLVQAGYAYDPRRCITFGAFAYYRIRGALLKLLHETARTSKCEQDANEYLPGYSPDGLSNDNAGTGYLEIANLSGSSVVSYLLSTGGLDKEPIDGNLSPINRLLLEEQRRMIRKAIAALPEKNRLVLHSYYFKNLNFDEIGKKLGLSKSWVSRIHARSLELLPRLFTWLESRLEYRRYRAAHRLLDSPPQDCKRSFVAKTAARTQRHDLLRSKCHTP